MSRRINLEPPFPTGSPAYPPGCRLADLDRGVTRLDDLSPSQLWPRLTDDQQMSIFADFFHVRWPELAALLEHEPSDPAITDSIRSRWLDFRDATVEQFALDGLIADDDSERRILMPALSAPCPNPSRHRRRFVRRYERIADPWLEGYLAHSDMIPLRQNPYRQHPDHGPLWTAGWHEADTLRSPDLDSPPWRCVPEEQ